MKKFIFSAVAMIAFVGSSMANNEVKVVAPPTISSCVSQAMANLDETCAYDTLTDQQILDQFNLYYNTCMGNKVTLKKAN